MNRILRMLLMLCVLYASKEEMLARQACTNADFFGPFGFQGSGSVLQAPPDRQSIVGPFARLGRLVASGDGRLIAAYERGSYNGLIYSDPFDGTYNISPDCTIMLLLNAPEPVNLPIPFVGVMLGDGNVRMKTLAPGAVVTATLRKQTIRECSAESLFGTFLFELSGSILPPSPLAGMFVRLGKLVADGRGAFTADTFVSYNGLSAPERISGTYRIDSECKLVLDYTEAGESGRRNVTVEGVMTDRKTAMLLVTKPFEVTVTGTLTR